MPICPSCGREQAGATAFCDQCGAVMDRPATSELAPPPAAMSTPPTTPIQTLPFAPAQVPTAAPTHHYGDVGAYIVRRLFALLADIVVAGGLIAVAANIWIESMGREPRTAIEVWEGLGLVGAVWFMYRWLFEGITGSTAGKLVFGLAVGHKGGGRAGLTRAFFRNLLLPIDLLIIGFFLGALTPLRQRLGDLVAGTVVAGSRLGFVAPLVGVAIFAAAFVGVHFYGGMGSLTRFSKDAIHYASLLESVPTVPSANSSPLPTR
jgi:uncharacterized RDD family membrane protein YckC